MYIQLLKTYKICDIVLEVRNENIREERVLPKWDRETSSDFIIVHRENH